MDQNSFMKKAFALAKKGRGSTGLNPMVGAVLIKDNKVIGKGFHKEFGGPHAEVVAIADAESRGNDVTSSTLVTSLEPCCHKGKKTPPCTDLIIEKKIKKVIYGSIDQNPKVKGRGIADLRRHRIETVLLDYEKENRLLNRGFLKVVAKNRPFVTLKICRTLDGMIFNKVSGSPNIGDEEQLTHSNKLRAEFDAILVGVETIIKDNPRLTYRGAKSSREIYLRPVVLDSNLRTPLDSKVVRLKNNPIIFTKLSEDSSRAKKLIDAGCTVITMQDLSPKKVLRKLLDNNLATILVEGGAKIFSSFLESNIFDELIVYYVNSFMGNSGLGVTNNLSKEFKKLKDRNCTIKKMGNSSVMVFS